MAEAASDREVHVGQGELRGFLQIKVKRSCDQKQTNKYRQEGGKTEPSSLFL